MRTPAQSVSGNPRGHQSLVAGTAVVGVLTAITGGLLAIVTGPAGYPVGLTLLAAAPFLGGIALAASWIWVDSRARGSRSGAQPGGLCVARSALSSTSLPSDAQRQGCLPRSGTLTAFRAVTWSRS